MISRHKWNIIRFLGCVLPQMSALQKQLIRKQLDDRYCPHCGEYLFNLFPKRRMKHYHHLRNKHKFTPLLQQRIYIHAHNQLVEWRRRFPRVMRLIMCEQDLFFYKNMKPQFIHRIPAVRMWTVDEWNTLHPTIYIWEQDCTQRLQYSPLVDVLWVPDLVL